MKVLFLAVLLSLVLAGCSIDPCSIDQNSPTCDTRRSEARATIGAIEGQSNLEATRSALFVSNEATKAAISVKATKQVVQAEATQSAMNIEATSAAITAAQQQSAVIYKSTQTFAEAEATKISVNVNGVIERARIESAAVPASSAFNVVVFWFLLPALVVLGLIVYGRRTMHRATEALTQTLSKRAAMITYGPANNPQMALITFNPQTGLPERLNTTEGLIGPSLQLTDGATALDDLSIPDAFKLGAMIEATKRAQAARIAAATGIAPWSTSPARALESAAPLPMPEPATLSVPRIPTMAELVQTWRPSLDQMLYGFDELGKPIYGGLDRLLSALVIGRQGQGKTTLLRLIYLQCAMTGVQVIAWDVHDDIAEDLPNATILTDPKLIERSAAEMSAEIDHRIALKLKHDKARPLMILIDEINSVVERAPAVVDLVKRIVSEGRKYRMFEFVTAKGAPSDIFERSWARDSFSALFAFWTSSLQARNAGFESDAARMAEGLVPGRAVLRLQTAPAQVITFPDIPAEDMRRLLPGTAGHAMPASRPASGPTSEPLPGWTIAASEKAEKSGESGENGDSEVDYFEGVEADSKREIVKRLIRDGKSQREIISEVWGATGGNAYKVAAAELKIIIQELIQ